MKRKSCGEIQHKQEECDMWLTTTNKKKVVSEMITMIYPELCYTYKLIQTAD